MVSSVVQCVVNSVVSSVVLSHTHSADRLLMSFFFWYLRFDLVHLFHYLFTAGSSLGIILQTALDDVQEQPPLLTAHVLRIFCPSLKLCQGS